MLAGSFPKTDQGYLAWVALVPLLLFASRAKTSTHAFAGGFAAGAVEFAVLLVWMPAVLIHYGGVPTILAWGVQGLAVVVLAIYPGIACALMVYCIRRRGEICLFVFPFLWVVLEYLRGYIVVGGFPWLQLGYSQTNYLWLIQTADVAGVFGLSFVIVWTNSALAYLLLTPKRRFLALWPLAAAMSMIAGCALYGYFSLLHWNQIKPGFKVGLLQGNLSVDESENVLAAKFMNGYIQMADQLKSQNIDLLVLPESPAPLSYQYDAGYRKTLTELAKRYSLGLIFNNIAYADVGSEIRYYNSAYFLGGDGKEIGRYDKIHLVPFGEYIPWQSLFSFGETVSKDVGAFSPGEKYSVVAMGGHPANAVICYEIIFPDLVRRFVQNGSGLIVNLTNDQWYGESAAPYQHFTMSRWRAIENRRYLLRAANSGVSAIVEPTGRIQVETGLLLQAVCVGRFAFISDLTVYSRHGDFLVMLCAIIMLSVLISTQISPAKGSGLITKHNLRRS